MKVEVRVVIEKSGQQTVDVKLDGDPKAVKQILALIEAVAEEEY